MFKSVDKISHCPISQSCIGTLLCISCHWRQRTQKLCRACPTNSKNTHKRGERERVDKGSIITTTRRIS